jgi:AcrR family transcriptional regulator
MPKIVDAEARRREVAAAAATLLVDGGRGALTVRSVADAVGCSTTVVSHYFEDMADLVHATYTIAVERSSRRIVRVLERDPADITGLVEAVLPLDRERADDWRIWFAFWSEALTSSTFATEQRARARTMLTRIGECLDLLVADGAIAPDVDLSLAARRLAALVPGIAAEATFDPSRWPPERQREVLRSELELLGLDVVREARLEVEAVPAAG